MICSNARVSPRATRCARSTSESACVSVGANAGIGFVHLVAGAGVVVPVELARLLALRELVRSVAVRLVLRQAALAEPLLLAVDHELGGLGRGASHDAGHLPSCFK